MKIQKGTLETSVLFFLSPLLSLPAIFFQLTQKRDKWMPFVIACFIGMLSYSYIPHITDDKVFYMDNYVRFTSFSFNDFLVYLALYKIPDFFFPFSFFVFAKAGIDVNWLFFIITTFTVWSFLVFVKKSVSKVSNLEFIYSIPTILIVLLCFSIPTLLSGIRFILAGSIFVWGIYFLFIEKHIVKSTIFFAVGILTHFSFAFFIPAVLFVYFFNKKNILKLLLICSLVFLLLPKDSLGSILSAFSLPESYSLKTEAYLTGEREYSTSAILIRYINRIWLFLAYLYLLRTKKKEMNILYSITIVFMSFINITYSLPIVFSRYTSISIILFTTYLLSVYCVNRKKRIVLYMFLSLFFISFVMDIIISRNNIQASYRIPDMLTSVQIFNKKISHDDIIK